METITDHPIVINPRRSIGGIYFQVVIEEQHTDSLEITDHPVEDGASINDHAYKKPEMVSITAGTSATEGNIKAIYEKLLELQKKREPFEIVTGKRQYKNMLIEQLTVNTDKATENVLRFTANCKEIKIVGLVETSLPPREVQAMPEKTASPEDGGNVVPVEVKESAAVGIGKLFGKEN